MKTNSVIVDGFSNPDSEARYKSMWPNEPELVAQYETGKQCGACSFFAPFDPDYGLCCRRGSRHFTETVLEHFTCPSYVPEGWGPHSFSEDPSTHCQCQGEPVFEKLALIVGMLGQQAQEGEIAAQLRVIQEYIRSQRGS